jgi:ribosomal protein L21E
MAAPNGGDIIIKGGSVAMEFNESTYTGKDGKYGNQQKKIVNVEVTDDNTGQVQTVNVPANGRCTIKISAH